MPKPQIVKWGNSLAVRIPKTIAEQAHLQEGDSLIIEASGEGLSIRRAHTVPSLPELVAKITPENRYGEVSSGVETGRETVEW